MDFDADCQTEWYVCGLRLDSYILYLKGIKMHRWCLRAWFGNRRGKTHRQHFVQVKKQKDRCDSFVDKKPRHMCCVYKFKWTETECLCASMTAITTSGQRSPCGRVWAVLLKTKIQKNEAPSPTCNFLCITEHR